jgi:predicted amidophosphoribosyltransferase
VGILASALQSPLQTPVLEVLARPTCSADPVKEGAATQTARNAAQRRQALQAAFVLQAGSGNSVAGARVLLVDDVVTTGSTLSACAEVLYGAGAATVVGLTIANVR